MGNKNRTSRELVLTQLELSLLLGVNRSLLSMYELKQRTLPTTAFIKLSEIYIFIKESQEAGKSVPQILWQKEMNAKLSSLLSDNELNRMVIMRKIIDVEKYHEEQSKMRHMLENFAKQTDNKSATVAKYIDIISNKTSAIKEAKTSLALFELQMKLQLLELEKQLLESKLKQMEYLSK